MTRTANDWGREAGELLVQRRRALGLTQEEVAERSELSVRTISDLERGHTRRPRPRSIQLLAAALNLDSLEIVSLFRARWDSHHQEVSDVNGIDIGEAIERETKRPADRVLPRQIPMAARHFAGRAQELRALSALLDENPRTVALTVICGPRGAGKTALAVYWAHRVSKRFVDGQLYVDLRGSRQRGGPVSPADAIYGFLEAFHMPPERIPASLEARAALYRSLLADKKVLIVLDDAQCADQVLPLLPGSAGCLVVVTSRDGLVGLVASHGARPLTLGMLSAFDAREFLAGLLGRHRVAAEEAAVTELIQRCNRSPLALSTAAARAAMCPSLSIADLLMQENSIQPSIDSKV